MKILTRLSLPFMAILLMFCWYKFSSVSGAAIETASIMDTVPSFGQNQPVQIDSIPTTGTILNAVESLPDTSKEEIKPIVQDVLNNGNLGELVIDSLGMFLYIGIALIGVLMMLRYSSLNKAWAILCLGTLFISFMPPLFGYTILKERWWFLSQAFLAVPLAVCLMGIANIGNKK